MARETKKKRGGAKAEKRSGSTRLPWARMRRLNQIFQRQWKHRDSGRPFANSERLAAELEVSVRTVMRDLDFMRDFLEMPVEYDHVRRGYGFTQEVTHFPSEQMSEGELFALCIARLALESYRGTPFEPKLRSAFRKLMAQLDGEVSFDLEALEWAISFRPTGFGAPVDLQIFEEVIRAVLDRAEVEFEYCKLGADGSPAPPERRTVEPRLLAYIEGAWYLFSRDVQRAAIRKFALTRMGDFRRTGRHFRVAAPLDLEAEMAGGMGAFTSGQPAPVRMRFAPSLRQIVTERQWHHSQEVRMLEDGGVELTMRVAHTPDLERWVLGWGGKATVLEPPALREAVVRAAEEILASRG